MMKVWQRSAHAGIAREPKVAGRTSTSMGIDEAETRPSDAEIIVLSRDHPEMFVEIFYRHYRDIRRYLARRVGADAADDLASETFVQALTGLLRYDSSQVNARPWLFGIASNLLRQHYKRETREYRTLARTGHDSVADHAESVATRVSAQACASALAAALAALNPETATSCCCSPTPTSLTSR